MLVSRRLLILALLLVLTGTSRVACAGLINVTIDTASLSGTNAALAFDFIRGDAIGNSVSILDFSTDGMLGAASALGGNVSGVLPQTVTLGDSDFFNELLQNITFGSSVSFTLSFTQTFVAPTPTAFSLFLLDSAGVPLFDTTDPTGAGALFALDIDGSEFGNYQTFDAIDASITLTATPHTPTTPVPVPEPPTLLLALAAVLAARVRAFRDSFASKLRR